jgi:ABC-type Zn uptake system ZnuABC Zn-binding protein ZnuA
MTRTQATIGIAALLAFAGAARADDKIKVVCTLPHLAAHARAIGGDKVDVTALARGDQDPHYVQPTPSLMVEANQADLYVEEGLELEMWSEHVIDGSRNARIRVTQPGHVYASQGVPLLGVPAVLTRAQGDIHPYGNPHVWLSPLNAVIEARNVLEGLRRVDEKNGDFYAKNEKDYEDRLLRGYAGDDLVKLLGAETLLKLGLEGKLLDFLDTKKFKGEPLAKRAGGWLGHFAKWHGAKLVAYHAEWVYFARDFGFTIDHYVEPKPGIPPSPSYLQELKEYIVREKVPAIVHTPYFSASNFEVLGHETGAAIVLLPTEVGGTPDAATDYVTLFDAITKRLGDALDHVDRPQ